ncbi:MAG TPA: hypothetical protein VHF51_16530 [Solirubrobacteraceae bacterium]|nr:hypothetical protein [Solirubrobacteraceae bacterium]
MPARLLRPLVLALALSALALSALAPAGARAAADLETGIADDAAVLEEPDPARAARTVATWRDLGIDDVRLLVHWEKVSPRPDDARVPAGFDPGNPADPRYEWRALDAAVALVRDAGMTVTLSITGPGPLWASAQPAAGNRRLRPQPALYARFARAVALRFGAAVDRYVLWNEPNLPLWLQPQFTCRGRRCTPYAPHLYRSLVRAAAPAIHAADSDARVLIGALAPSGHNPRTRNAIMRPLTFLRALGCVDRRARRVRSGRCRGFRPAAAEGIAYHPHGVRRAPDVPARQPDDAGLADLPRLERLVDAIQRRGGVRNTLRRTRRFDLFLTEYGYQTNPPDRVAGVRPALQARWLQQGTYLAWRDPRVRSLTQYVWRDEPVGFNGARWQSGLLFGDERPKPALRSFPQPFWADRTLARRATRLWGQVRPGGAHEVRVQRRAPGSAGWTTIRRLRTNGRGIFTLRVAVTRAVDYRFTWAPSPGAAVRVSDVRRVAPR